MTVCHVGGRATLWIEPRVYAYTIYVISHVNPTHTHPRNILTLALTPALTLILTLGRQQ